MQKGITIFRWKFLSHSAENFRRRTLLCFRKFLVSKDVKDMRDRGHQDFPSKICCLTVPKNIVGEIFCVSEKFWYRKMLEIREGGGYHEIPSKICCPTVPINLVGETFCVPENFWYRKILGIREGGEYQEFPSKICCLTVPKNFVWETLCFRKILVSKIFMDKRGRGKGGVPRFSVKKFVSHSAEKTRGETLCVSKNFWYRKILLMRGAEEGSITTFRQNFFISQCWKIL